MSQSRISIKSLAPLTFAAALAALMPAPVLSAESAPSATVEVLHSTLIEVMQNADALGFEGRREKLAPVITRSFDLATICRIILGRQWDELSPEDHAQMIDTFTRLTIATYAARFDGYSGESFRTVEQNSMNRGRVMVRTELVRPQNEPVHLDYVLQDGEGGWRIVNVVAEGVSDLSLKRADYGSVIKRDGFPTLVQRLENQIRDLQKGA